jgi:hypothetical protein
VPGAVVSAVARRHGVTPQQVFGWRREARRATPPISSSIPALCAARSGGRVGAVAGGKADAICIEAAVMIGPSGAVRVMVATRPVDFRKGVDGLAALVRDSGPGSPP